MKSLQSPSGRLALLRLWLVALAIAGGMACAAAHAKDAASACTEDAGFAVLTSPVAPWTGAPLRVVITTETPIDGELSLIAPDGTIATASRVQHGGPPYFWIAEVATPAVGAWRAQLVRDKATSDCRLITHDIAVRRVAGAAARSTAGSVWPVRETWSRATENLYSAWIETLFAAPLDEAPSWAALHDVLRDKSRNLLFNHLGLKEDEKDLVFRPDCADLPYFLRGYFAFKLGLPFGYAKCSRGGGGKPPQCPAWWSIQNEETAQSKSEAKTATVGLLGIFDPPDDRPAAKPKPQGLAQSFGYYMRSIVANKVHSGSGRTLASDNNTDYYPISLKQETLRPGTVYADPYGHILVLAKRVAQTGDGAGVFLAVDGQPDGTVSRKRFWRGNFLFAQDASLGSPGFKRFRPIVREKSGVLRRLTNDEIAKNSEYSDFSLEQTKLSVEAFYDAMDDVMSPAPLDPLRAMTEAITALEEQVKARVTSVENGRKYHSGGGRDVEMPTGASIFETTGAWEDFATPSRDLRLLIAIDVVRGFPERVARRPERYAMPKDKTVSDVKAELEVLLATELAARKVSYTRSDGSAWPLTIKDVVDRTSALETAYNLNDCVEVRWGASDKSDEAAPCKRRASVDQRKRMTEYQAWFRERRRPPRG